MSKPKFAFVKFAPDRFAFVKFAPDRFALVKFASDRFASDRFAPGFILKPLTSTTHTIPPPLKHLLPIEVLEGLFASGRVRAR